MRTTTLRETTIREYRREADYRRDALHRRRDGWSVVSVLKRPRPAGPLAGLLHRLTLGASAAVLPPRPELLVTYSRVARPAESSRPLRWLLAPRLPSRAPARHWGWIVVALLAALLLIGFASFFAADAAAIPPLHWSGQALAR